MFIRRYAIRDNLTMDKNVIFEYLRNVYSTILLKDVVARESIRMYLLENISSLSDK